MQRAGNSINAVKVVLVILLGLSLATLAWREVHYRKRLGEAAQAAAAMAEALAQRDALLEEREQRLQQLSASLTEMEIGQQSMADRISNLEAQRDHLRLDNEKRTRRTSDLESEVAAMEKELAESRHAVLQMEALPGKLSVELAAAHARISGLESELDKLSAELSDAMSAYAFTGKSTDGKVFSVSGTIPDEAGLPQAVHLCNRDGLLLDGWLRESVDGQIIGHVLTWHQPASALVKGEKVFILPRNSHEQHH